ncbi:TlpA family protein disulfide reductase [Psychroserpens sp. NJDZ02]|uniref:TlpA family protein disulfide reductase n=1 Tax=Psychroserpens sp. NJDZ02 TaxID=2570561 RepID=UPI0010A80B7F|nr:TlpA disulfide reductase family protein [Psychroserpens sp. NJDZ02]QCE42012.1 redoxin domain-containing protein [Psychroserpens sp. NJDZ02]
MKNTIITIFLLVLFTNTFAQKTIENPEYGLITIPSSITKIEILDTATVLHFHIKSYTNRKITISDKSYIEVIGSDKKLLVTKSEGITLNEEESASDTSELFYSLHFPKLETNVKTIDFVEVHDNEENNAYAYDIVIDQENASMLPLALRGNWMRMDGSNLWDYGFYPNNAIIDRAVWNYKKVTNKGKKYTITLEREGALKTVYAKLNKNGRVDFGATPKQLVTYSLTKLHNPNFKLENDLPYESASLLKLDSTTYSGVIKGYTERVKEKAYVNIAIYDAFTLKVEPLKAKIKADGSFSIKFPANYPQHILVFSTYNTSQQRVYIEQGKETFHFINEGTPLFMGDCAILNDGLTELKSINSFFNNKIMKELAESTISVSPEDYKKALLKLRDKDLTALKELNQKHFFSRKALQTKKMWLKFIAMNSIHTYERRRNYQIKNLPPEKEGTLIIDYKIEPSFYDFYSRDIFNDRLGLLATPYFGYIANSLTSDSSFKNENDSARDIENNIQDRLNLENTVMMDFIRFRRFYGDFFNEGNNFTEADIENAKQEIKDPFLSDYLTITAKRIKATQVKSTSNINTVEKAEGEELFEALIKKFNGKVIYVDFWATWCGACVTFIKKTKSFREEMKDKDVVFLYISGESKKAPENTWRQVIADINGEHYWLTEEQWNYLLNKFNFNGIPHYMIINKKGEVVNDNLIHPSIEELKAVLNEELAKE